MYIVSLIFTHTISGMYVSSGAFHRVLKLACTFADLAREEKIAPTHLAEALQYRPKLTQF